MNEGEELACVLAPPPTTPTPNYTLCAFDINTLLYIYRQNTKYKVREMWKPLASFLYTFSLS